MTSASRNFIRLSLVVTFGFLALVVLINYLVDPIGLYHFGKPWDWIHTRPQIDNYLCMHKAHAVIDANADVLFLGSSRTQEGLDPHHLSQPTYNLALLGSGPYENLRYLQHATAAHTPAVVILGIDLEFFSFNRGIIAGFSENRLLVKSDGHTPQTIWYVDLAQSLLSNSALECSFRTLIAPSQPALTYDKGYGGRASYLLGGWNLARQVLLFNSAVATVGAPAFRGPDGSAPQLAIFKQLLTFCAARNIKLYVFVHPLHAMIVDRFTKNWPAYTDWLSSVMSAIDSTPRLNCTTWDFAGYNAITTEPFPQPTDVFSHMQYYNECSHYNGTVGNMVLDRMLAHTGPNRFGQPITSATLPSDLARLKSEKEAWHSSGKLAPLAN